MKKWRKVSVAKTTTSSCEMYNDHDNKEIELYIAGDFAHQDKIIKLNYNQFKKLSTFIINLNQEV